MRRILFIVWVLLSFGGTVVYPAFNEWNVWHAVDGVTVTSGSTTMFGPLYMATHEKEYFVLAYGTTGGDSLYGTINIYGMMSPVVEDTIHMVLAETTTGSESDKVIVLSDTLINYKLYPFLYGKYTNNHPSKSTVLDLYLYSRPRDLTRTR